MSPEAQRIAGSMSPDAQRIAIAEACGWTKAPDVNACWFSPDGHDHGWFRERELPDYLNDLNAMHGAEKVLEAWRVEQYIRELAKLTGNRHTVYHATAAQRAEAFLHTIGKWEDSQ